MNVLRPSQIYNALLEIKHLIKQQNFEPMDIKQAAEYLKLKPSYLYSLTHQNKIPYYKPGGKRIYFNKVELNKWITESKIKSVGEVEEDYNKQKETEAK